MYKPITIEGIWNKKIYTDHFNSENRNYIPLYYNKTIQSILQKTVDNDNIQKFDVHFFTDHYTSIQKEHLFLKHRMRHININ